MADGETLSDIADQYGLATSTLAEANGIDDPDLVVIGTVLSIPAVGPDGDGASSSLPKRLRQSPDRLALMGVFDIWAARYDVPPDLLKATTWLESGWQNDVVSSTGAVGIGQLMPITVDTVNELMGTNLSPWVPDQNIRMSARNLRFLLDLTGGDTRTGARRLLPGPRLGGAGRAVPVDARVHQRRARAAGAIRLTFPRRPDLHRRANTQVNGACAPVDSPPRGAARNTGPSLAPRRIRAAGSPRRASARQVDNARNGWHQRRAGPVRVPVGLSDSVWR